MKQIITFDSFLTEQEHEEELNVVLESKRIIGVFEDYENAHKFFLSVIKSLYPKDIEVEMKNLKKMSRSPALLDSMRNDLFKRACENVSWYQGNPEIYVWPLQRIMGSLESKNADIDSVVKNSDVSEELINRMKKVYRGKDMFGI